MNEIDNMLNNLKESFGKDNSEVDNKSTQPNINSLDSELINQEYNIRKSLGLK